ncbi:hypothetical protein J4481_01145 [Candidatus Pacearchaeota archaeon]|nr:hypothetical protein [Candidatus Pacearchaeota archaeon]
MDDEKPDDKIIVHNPFGFTGRKNPLDEYVNNPIKNINRYLGKYIILCDEKNNRHAGKLIEIAGFDGIFNPHVGLIAVNNRTIMGIKHEEFLVSLKQYSEIEIIEEGWLKSICDEMNYKRYLERMSLRKNAGLPEILKFS